MALRGIPVRVTAVFKYPDDRLYVRGYVNFEEKPVVAWGHSSWLEKYWDENSPIDENNRWNLDEEGALREDAAIPVKRQATPEEGRAYCERLLLEAVGLWGIEAAPIPIPVEPEPLPGELESLRSPAPVPEPEPTQG